MLSTQDYVFLYKIKTGNKQNLLTNKLTCFTIVKFIATLHFLLITQFLNNDINPHIKGWTERKKYNMQLKKTTDQLFSHMLVERDFATSVLLFYGDRERNKTSNIQWQGYFIKETIWKRYEKFLFIFCWALIDFNKKDLCKQKEEESLGWNIPL